MIRPAAFALTLLVPAAAVAQPIQGLYIGGNVGVNFSGTLESIQNTIAVHTNPGPVGAVSFGWGFGNGLRAEIEGSFWSNSISSIDTLRTNGRLEPLDDITGDARTYAVMANAAYDIPYHPFGLPITPYVGAGVGYAWLDLGSASGFEPFRFLLPENNTVTAPAQTSYGTAGAFAYQAKVGASVPLAILPGLSATLEYRFFGTARINMPARATSVAIGDTVNGVIPTSSGDRRFVLHENAVLFGLRYAFGSAPIPVADAAPIPAPAAMPSRSYLVFFDWDKATLTDRARQIVAEAAVASNQVRHTRIEVNGYTDTSGTPRYNQTLSVRRAQAVAAELVKDGVPKTAIAIQGFGETHLLVPTGPGVREPQNRRVEIVIM